MKRFTSLLSALALLFTAPLALAQTGPAQYRVDNINALLQITLFGTDAKVTAWVGGASARDDGLGGMFFYDGNSSAATNTYAVYKPVNNTGRWWKLPTSVAYQTAVMNPASETTAAWTLLRAGQTNFLGIGADNDYAYIQSFNSKPLQLNPIGNVTALNSSAGNVGIGTFAPASFLEIRGGLTTAGSVLTLGTKEPTVVASDVLGRINFYAPLDAAGTDANLVAGSIASVAEGTFSATSNASSLIFQTGASEIATTKMTLTSAGNLTVTGGVSVGGGSSILAIYTAAAQIDFPSIAVGGWTNMPITVTGAGTNSVVSVSSAGGAPAAGVLFTAYVSATNTVQISGGNVTLTAIDPATTSYRVTVFQY